MARNQNELTPKLKPVEAGDDSSNRDPLYDLEFHHGPLPDVQDFAAYDKVLPGAANRILKMTERDQKAMIRLGWANWFTNFASLIIGKGFLYCLVAAAVYLAVKGKPIEALFAGLAPIVTVIYANTRKDNDTPSEENK